MRWGMRPPRTDGPPVTNARNTSSPHWRSRLRSEKPLPGAPFNSFAEYALELVRDQRRSAAVYLRESGRVQGRRRHEIEARSRPPIYGFLTTAANAVVEPIHSTAMPVIPVQQSLPDDTLSRDARTRKIVPRLESPRALSWLGPFNLRQQKSRGCAGMSVWGDQRT
jgi:putative SOS response-associated peptidase YedK